MKYRILFFIFFITTTLPLNVLADDRIFITGHNIEVDSLSSIKGTLSNSNGTPVNYFKAEIDYTLEFWTLLAEPVFNCTAKWRYIPSDVWVGKVDFQNREQHEIMANEARTMESQLRLYDVELMVSLGNVGNTPKYKTQGLDDFHNLFVRCDTGALTKSRGSTSLNSPYSSDWNKTIAVSTSRLGEQSRAFGTFNKDNTTPYAHDSAYVWLSASDAKKVVKHLKAVVKTTGQTHYKTGSVYSGDYAIVTKASYGIEAFKNYISKRNRKKEKERKRKQSADVFEKRLNETEASSQPSNNDSFEDLLGSTENTGDNAQNLYDDQPNQQSFQSFEDMLDDSEAIEIAFYDVPRQTTKNVINIRGKVINLASIDESNITYRLNGIEQMVQLNQDGSFSNKVVLFNGQNTINIVYTSLGKEQRRTFHIKSSTRPVKARFTLVWDSINSDMDLHVTGPSNEHCFYQNNTTANMQLDVDNTQKYGPENISVKLNQRPGLYKASIKHYGGNAGNVTLYVYLDDRLVATKKKYLSGNTIWQAYELNIN